MRYTVRLYLNDGEKTWIVAQNLLIEEILPAILTNIKLHWPEWKWGFGDDESGWGDISIRYDGCTYIRLQGIGDVRKGQTYYIVEPME